MLTLDFRILAPLAFPIPVVPMSFFICYDLSQSSHRCFLDSTVVFDGILLLTSRRPLFTNQLPF